MNDPLRIYNLAGILLLLSGALVAYVHYFSGFDWWGLFGNGEWQLIIGNVLIFAGLMFRGYYRLKKFGKWFP